MIMRLIFGREPTRRFSVFEPAGAAVDRIDRAEQLQFLSDRFSFAAFFWAPLWLLGQRLWLPLLGYVAAFAAIWGAADLFGISAAWPALTLLGLHLAIGYEAEALSRWALTGRGWRMIGEVSGRSIDECERRFFDSWLPAQTMRGAGTASGPGPAAMDAKFGSAAAFNRARGFVRGVIKGKTPAQPDA